MAVGAFNVTLKKYFLSSRSSIKEKKGKTMNLEDEKFLRDIVNFIESKLDDESLNPNSLVEFLRISKASLYERLKKLTDRTPSEYIRYIRLEYASKLLCTTTLTVSEIIFKSGFSSKSYFYREFLKQYELSPKEFRSKYLKIE